MTESEPPVPKFKAGGMPRTASTTTASRMKVSELNAHLMCVLCSGYLVDATTIIECLHSYCRTCIVKYFEKNQKCPVCDTKVNKTRPLLNIRSDKTLQNLVYKLVPNLFKNEMKRRNSFYSDNSQASTSNHGNSPLPPDNTSTKMETDAVENSFVIFSDDEHISLSLEYYLPTPTTRKPDTATQPGASGSGSSDSLTMSIGSNQSRKRANGGTNVSEELVDKRFLRCPAAVSIGHLKKFIRHKFSLPPSYQIEIMHKDGEDAALRDGYTLVDVAYIYNWKRNCQLPLLYRVYEPPNKRPKFAAIRANDPPTSNSTEVPSMPGSQSNEHSNLSTTEQTTCSTSKDQNRNATTIGGNSSSGPKLQTTVNSRRGEQPVPMVS